VKQFYKNVVPRYDVRFDFCIKMMLRGRKTKHKKHNTTQKTKEMNNTDHTKTLGWNRCSRWVMSSCLFLIRHPPCYTYSQYILDATIRKQTSSLCRNQNEHRNDCSSLNLNLSFKDISLWSLYHCTPCFLSRQHDSVTSEPMSTTFLSLSFKMNSWNINL
jgi:hypothetical protein